MTTSRKEKTILSALAAGAALLAMWIAEPPSAHAAPDPADVTLFCARLDVDASPPAIAAVAGQMIADGLTRDQAAEVIDTAVTTGCPEHLQDVKDAIAFYQKKKLLRAI